MEGSLRQTLFKDAADAGPAGRQDILTGQALQAAVARKQSNEDLHCITAVTWHWRLRRYPVPRVLFRSDLAL